MAALYFTEQTPQRLAARLSNSSKLKAGAILRVYRVPNSKFNVWSSTTIKADIIQALNLELVLETPLRRLSLVATSKEV